MRNVNFTSWEQLLATHAGAPSGPGFRHVQGDNQTIIKLDPVRIFGWVAFLLVNVCMWGLVLYFGEQNKLIRLVFVMLYGMALRWMIVKHLGKALAGIFWPILPLSVAAA